MEKHIQQVKEFYTQFNIPILALNEVLNVDRKELRHNLLQEEVNELYNATQANDIIEVADAITDCFYILLGTAIEFGIEDKLVACFDEVHRSNMSKLDENGNPLIRDDGKIVKSSLYSPPDLKNIIFYDRFK